VDRRQTLLARQLGRRIVELRKEAGLTQEQLAWSVEMRSKGYLSRIESGQRLPSLDILDRLAHELHVEPRDLLTFPDAGAVHAAIDLLRRQGPAAADRLLGAAKGRRPGTGTGPAEPAVLRAAEVRRPKQPPRR
jgi:transcriptional regulator with XRE-family HTH domain